MRSPWSAAFVPLSSAFLADGGYQPVEFSEAAPMLEQLKLVVPEIIVLDLGASANRTPST